MHRVAQIGRVCSRGAILGALLCAAQPALAQEAQQQESQQAAEQPFKTDFSLAAANENKHFCQIVITQNGRLAPNAGATKLTSLGYAGEAARAEVTTTNGSYYASIDRPNGFAVSPNGGNADVVFASYLSGTGKTNFADTPGSERVKLKNGKTNLNINLEVSKQRGAFASGHYRADLTLRCE
jgi:hypothetical protein